MKTLNITIRTIIVFLLAGALFISCELADPDAYGTLVIALPGSGSARAAGDTAEFSENFLADLRYVVDCTGPGKESKEFGPNGNAAILLSPGDWTVTVTVFNAAEEEKKEIGRSESKVVTIEAGKTTPPVTIEINITTSSSNEITKFTITNPVEAKKTINGVIKNNTIVVTVPPEADLSNVKFDVEHNGYKISHKPDDDTLNFKKYESYTFSVQPEYGTTRVYTVTVKVEEAEQPGGTWPAPEEWAEYGLGGLQQPDETKVVYVIEDLDSLNRTDKSFSLPGTMKEPEKGMDFLMVKLNGADINFTAQQSPKYLALYNKIVSLGFSTYPSPRQQGEDYASEAGKRRWDIFSNNSDTFVNLYMNSQEEFIIIMAYKDDLWNEAPWEEYGLAGLEQPDGTEVVLVIKGEPGTLSDNTEEIKDQIKDLNDLTISSRHDDYFNHLIVILKIKEDIKDVYTNENLYNDIMSSGYNREREDPVRFSKNTDDKTYIISPQLQNGYIIILVREGKLNWYD